MPFNPKHTRVDELPSMADPGEFFYVLVQGSNPPAFRTYLTNNAGVPVESYLPEGVEPDTQPVDILTAIASLDSAIT